MSVVKLSMEVTKKLSTLSIGDVYEQTLAVFKKSEIPPTPARTENYDNRKGLKRLWLEKDLRTENKKRKLSQTWVSGKGSLG